MTHSSSNTLGWCSQVAVVLLVSRSSIPAPLMYPFTYLSWASLKLSRMAVFLVFLKCIASTSAGVRSRLAIRCTSSIAECSSSTPLCRRRDNV